jgi:hypothetical protein
MKKLAPICLFVCFVSACASRPEIIAPPTIEKNSKETLVRVPEINVRAEISVGESLFSQALKIESHEYDVQLKNSGKSSLDNGYTVSVSNGQSGKLYKLKGSFNAFCSELYAKSSSLDVLGGSNNACLVDFDNNGSFEKSMFSIYDRYFPLTPEVPYIVTPSETVTDLKTEKFRQEAVFQGVTNNAVKVLFREFYDNKIRSAFTQVIDYELDKSGSTTIVFKNFKAVVHKANSTNLVYSVITPF